MQVRALGFGRHGLNGFTRPASDAKINRALVVAAEHDRVTARRVAAHLGDVRDVVVILVVRAVAHAVAVRVGIDDVRAGVGHRVRPLAVVAAAPVAGRRGGRATRRSSSGRRRPRRARRRTACRSSRGRSSAARSGSRPDRAVVGGRRGGSTARVVEVADVVSSTRRADTVSVAGAAGPVEELDLLGERVVTRRAGPVAGAVAVIERVLVAVGVDQRVEARVVAVDLPERELLAERQRVAVVVGARVREQRIRIGRFSG